MSHSIWGYWLIALGIGVITVMMLVQNYTTINQEDYYLLKEVTQASMYDAIDYSHYRKYGEIKINREKFIENFTRRFAESVKGNKNYKLDFYDIYETPPKVSVKVSTKTSSFNVSGDTMDLDVTNSIDAILENNSKNTITRTYYTVPYSSCDTEKQDYLGYCKIGNAAKISENGMIEALLKTIHEDHEKLEVEASDIQIVSAKYLGIMTANDFETYIDQYDETYGKQYTSIDARSPEPSDLGRNNDYHDTLQANEIKDVKLTITDNSLLVWSAKFKCNNGHGYPNHPNSREKNADGSWGNSIVGQCNVGIKYEVKFSY